MKKTNLNNAIERVGGDFTLSPEFAAKVMAEVARVERHRRVFVAIGWCLCGVVLAVSAFYLLKPYLAQVIQAVISNAGVASMAAIMSVGIVGLLLAYDFLHRKYLPIKFPDVDPEP